jgi:hypothetical protein
MRSTPSPNRQGYTAPGMEYGSPLSMMVPRVMYRPSPLHLYPHNIRSARRGGIIETPIVLRSPILDEFRNSKARKWELRVC